MGNPEFPWEFPKMSFCPQNLSKVLSQNEKFFHPIFGNSQIFGNSGNGNQISGNGNSHDWHISGFKASVLRINICSFLADSFSVLNLFVFIATSNHVIGRAQYILSV